MYTAVIDSCAKAQQWQAAVALLRELQSNSSSSISTITTTAMSMSSTSSSSSTDVTATPNEHSYTAAIQACALANQWQLACELLKELQQTIIDLSVTLPAVTAAVDGVTAAGRLNIADKLYADTVKAGVLQHWSARYSGVLDLHGYSASMAQAAVRHVLRDMIAAATTAGCTVSGSSTDSSSSTTSSSRTTADGDNQQQRQQQQQQQYNSKQHVHDVNTDLHIITGHASSRTGQHGSVLQPSIISMLQQQYSAQCYVNSRNRGRLVVPATELVKLTKTAATTATTADAADAAAGDFTSAS
jgi:pentatricopeptide repeat protein